MRSFVAILVLPCFVVSFSLWRPDPLDAIGLWHKRTKPCKLPSFIDDLPTEAANKIKAIWSGYKTGDTCEAEHKLTREVIGQLTSEQKERVFSGKCGPSFLRNVSSTVRQEFKTVWSDPKLSAEDKETALHKLAYSLLSGESLALFNKWREELQERKKEIEIKIGNLSPDAQKAYNEWKQIRFTERNFLANLPKEVQSELGQLFGFGKKTENLISTTKETETTTTSTAQPTTETYKTSTTAKPIINEETKEKEFNDFFHSGTLEQMNSVDHCDFQF